MLPAEKRIYPWLCAATIIIAFILRMGQPDLVEFKRDEATVARLGQAIAHERYRPAVGVDSSVGIDNLPFNLYLMALPLYINPDPVSAVIFTTFLNACAVAICFWITQRTFGTPTALLATALFAVNPWAVLYARKIWCRTMPIFTLGFIVSNIAVFVWGKRWALVGSFISLTALIGLQLEGIAFIPIFLLILLLYRDKVVWRPFVAGLVLSSLFILPYIIYDAGQNWQNIRGLLAYSGQSGSLTWDAVRYAVTLAGSMGIEGQAGGLYKQFFSGVPNLWFGNSIIAYVLVAGVLYAGVQAFTADTQERRRLFTILLLWFLIPTLLQLRPSSATQRHYFVLHYPVQFILISIVIVDALKWLRSRVLLSHPQWHIIYRVVVTFLVLILLIWLVWQIAITISLRQYMVEHPSTGGYGIPLKYTRSAAMEALKLADDTEIIVVSDSTHPFMTETPTVFDALLFRHPHRFVDGRGALPFPKSDRTLYLIGLFPVIELSPPPIDELSAFPAVTEGPAVELPDGQAFKLYLRVSEDTSDVTSDLTPIGEGVPFANKVVFAGYKTDNALIPGEYLDVKLGWWLHGLPPAGVNYHFTVQLHLHTENDIRIVSQDDQVAYPAEYWQGGDTVLSYFSLPLPVDLPSGDYILQAGMYSYPEIIPVPVINPAGETIDDNVRLIQFKQSQ